MKRKELTNTPWERLQPLLPPQKPQTGRPAVDHRRLLNGILWILRTGAPWRDLPERYGLKGARNPRRLSDFMKKQCVAGLT
jgi:transposase